MIYAAIYWKAAVLLRFLYPKYRHYRELNLSEIIYIFPWAWRKFKYAYLERSILKDLSTLYSKNYYLVPLQVHRDSQIIVHSNFFSNIDFIQKVFESFALHARESSYIVFKQHSIDRAYNDYGAIINNLLEKYNISKRRCYYVHDLHLPTLLTYTRGVVLVNSTVGMLGLHYSCPMKVCGKAIYDIEGLTFQGKLNDFWKKAETFKVDIELWEKFRDYVISETQLNGSIYRKTQGGLNILA